MAAEATDWGTDPVQDPNEHRHTYRNNEGEEKTLVVDRHHVPVEDAAKELDIDAEQWAWVLTEGHALDGGIAPTAIPCDECADPVWTNRETAANVRNGEMIVRCGACVRAEEDDE